MSTIALAGTFLVAGSFIGAGLLVLLTGKAPKSPHPNWVSGAGFLLTGLAIALVQTAARSSGVLMLLAAFAGLGCLFVAAGLLIRYGLARPKGD
ncbi:hypothetical protein [Micromonospora sonchi]|nr:hypothetical protein [Micromonospora sonchi]